MPGSQTCFDMLVECSRLNSGMMFPIDGKLIENSKNYFFRNGMTVSFGDGKNGSTAQIPFDQQDAVANNPDSAITFVPTGLTRLWGTMDHLVRYLQASAGELTDNIAMGR
jgi:hypothetical protein